MKILIIDNATLKIVDLKTDKTYSLINLVIDFLNIDTDIEKEDIIMLFAHTMERIGDSLSALFIETIKNDGAYKAEIDELLRINEDRLFYSEYDFEAKANTHIKHVLTGLFNTINGLRYMLLNMRLPENKHKVESLKPNIEFSLSEYNGIFYDTFEFHNIVHFIFFTIAKSVQLNIQVKGCANCKKLFVPSIRSDEIYCDNIYKGNKTCKQVGYEYKVNNDDSMKYMKVYRTVYKTMNAKKNRNINNNIHAKDDFEKWANAAKIKLKDAQQGNMTISIEDFKKWLKEDK